MDLTQRFPKMVDSDPLSTIPDYTDRLRTALKTPLITASKQGGADQAMPASGTIQVTFQTGIGDAGMLNNSLLVAPIAGWYNALAYIRFSPSANGERACNIVHKATNGTTITTYNGKGETAPASTRAAVAANEALIRMAAGEWLQIDAYNDGAAGAVSIVGSAQTRASLQWLREA